MADSISTPPKTNPIRAKYTGYKMSCLRLFLTVTVAFVVDILDNMIKNFGKGGG